MIQINISSRLTVALATVVSLTSLGAIFAPLSHQTSARELAAAQTKSYNPTNPDAFFWPVRTTSCSSCYISQSYNYDHSGIDIAGPMGTPIHAVSSGTVVFAGWNMFLGNQISIEHDNGTVTVYGHNQSLRVNKGQKVKRGDLIALMGSTGNSTGPHLHFEVRIGGKDWNWTNPIAYLPTLVGGKIPPEPNLALAPAPSQQTQRRAAFYRVEVQDNSQETLERLRLIEQRPINRGNGVIQVGAFRYQSSAQKMVQELENLGIEARVNYW